MSWVGKRLEWDHWENWSPNLYPSDEDDDEEAETFRMHLASRLIWEMERLQADYLVSKEMNSRCHREIEDLRATVEELEGAVQLAMEKMTMLWRSQAGKGPKSGFFPFDQAENVGSGHIRTGGEAYQYLIDGNVAGYMVSVDGAWVVETVVGGDFATVRDWPAAAHFLDKRWPAIRKRALAAMEDLAL